MFPAHIILTQNEIKRVFHEMLNDVQIAKQVNEIIKSRKKPLVCIEASSKQEIELLCKQLEYWIESIQYCWSLLQKEEYGEFLTETQGPFSQRRYNIYNEPTYIPPEDTFRLWTNRDENFQPIAKFKDYLISGHGRKSDNCGKPLKGAWYSGNDLKGIFTSCHKQRCPNCFRTWAKVRSETIADSLWAKIGAISTRVIHATWSTPKDFYQMDDPYMVDLIVRLMKKHHDPEGIHHCNGFSPKKVGELAFTIVKHPYRLGKGQGWYFSPHLHLITNFYPKDWKAFNSDKKQFGLVYKDISYANFKKKKQKWNFIPNKDVLTKILNYELGHAQYIDKDSNTHSISYYGLFRNNLFRTISKNVVYVPELDDKGKPYFLIEAEYQLLEDGSWRIKTNFKRVLTQGKSTNIGGNRYTYVGGGKPIILRRKRYEIEMVFMKFRYEDSGG